MCIEYEDGYVYLRKDTNIRCWHGENLYFQLSIGLSFFLIWGILFPLYIFWKIKGQKNHLNEAHNLKLYGIFYIGLNDDSFYWEIMVINIRKFVIIIVATFLSANKSSLKVILKTLIILGLHWHTCDIYLETYCALQNSLYRS